MSFEPAGFTGDDRLPTVKSIVDYVFRYLGQAFVTGIRPHVLSGGIGAGEVVLDETKGLLSATAADPEVRSIPAAFRAQGDAPACSVCGSITVRAGSCYACPNCGNTTGCG